MKFATDKMLGRLAKWLRVIGQDVAYGPHLSGYGLIRAARREGRLILTRDRALSRKNPPHYLLIESDQFREQLKQVVRACHLDPFKEAFTRCVECNRLLEPATKAVVRDKVPPYVFSTQERFSLCPTCRRIFWPATHQQRMVEELKGLGFGTR
ncbi:MAG: Mut7-C RNAse domain-containing protein [Deltaproteobacteria bacterium]|nr:Mut7-C RNAse domain-containing protein [Deltaproteobacteria bacterium]